MIPYAFGSSDGLFNLGSALSFVQALPAGVYIAMNGRCFNWNRVRKNRDTEHSRTYERKETPVRSFLCVLGGLCVDAAVGQRAGAGRSDAPAERYVAIDTSNPPATRARPPTGSRDSGWRGDSGQRYESAGQIDRYAR